MTPMRTCGKAQDWSSPEGRFQVPRSRTATRARTVETRPAGRVPTRLRSRLLLVKIPGITDAIVQAVADLFDADRRPAHSDLDRLFARAGLQTGDPKHRDPTLLIGKRKRVLAVLTYSLDNNRVAGAKLAAQLIGAVRGVGGFRPASDDFVGADVLQNARAAFGDQGFELDDE